MFEIVLNALKHIRLIHYTLVITSSTALYIIIILWSNVPILIHELKNLEKSMILLNKQHYLPEWANERANNILKVIEKSLEIKDIVEINATVHSRRQMQIDHIKEFDQKVLLNLEDFKWPLDSATLEEWQFAFDRPRQLLVPTIKEIRFKPEAKEWVDDNVYTKVHIGGVTSVGIVDVIGISTSTTNSINTGDVIEVKFRATNGIITSQNPFPTMTVEDPVPFPGIVTISREHLTMLSDWFEETYPSLHALLKDDVDNVKKKNVHQTISFFKDKIKEKLRQEEKPMLQFFGISISGKDITYVVIIIITIQIYLLTHLMHISSQVNKLSISTDDSKKILIIPWVGAMSGIFPAAIKISTLVVLPTFVVWSFLFQVRAFGFVLTSLLSLPVVCLGYFCYLHSVRITKACAGENESSVSMARP
jgi:hypothetical protein